MAFVSFLHHQAFLTSPLPLLLLSSRLALNSTAECESVSVLGNDPRSQTYLLFIHPFRVLLYDEGKQIEEENPQSLSALFLFLGES